MDNIAVRWHDFTHFHSSYWWYDVAESKQWKWSKKNSDPNCCS